MAGAFAGAARTGFGAVAGSTGGNAAGNVAHGITARDAAVDDGWDASGRSGCSGGARSGDLVGAAVGLVGEDSGRDGLVAFWIHMDCFSKAVPIGDVREVSVAT